MNGADYNALSNYVVIPAGASNANITVTPRNDSLAEGEEAVSLTLFDSSSYNAGLVTNVVVIISDDEASTLPFALQIASPDKNVFRLTLTGPGYAPLQHRRVQRTGRLASMDSFGELQRHDGNSGINGYQPRVLPRAKAAVSSRFLRDLELPAVDSNRPIDRTGNQRMTCLGQERCKGVSLQAAYQSVDEREDCQIIERIENLQGLYKCVSGDDRCAPIPPIGRAGAAAKRRAWKEEMELCRPWTAEVRMQIVCARF